MAVRIIFCTPLTPRWPSHQIVFWSSSARAQFHSDYRARCSLPAIEQLAKANPPNGTVAHIKKRFASTESPSDVSLVSIIDHLDGIRNIPLADVRNFCIIAHVVSESGCDRLIITFAPTHHICNGRTMESQVWRHEY